MGAPGERGTALMKNPAYVGGAASDVGAGYIIVRAGALGTPWAQQVYAKPMHDKDAAPRMGAAVDVALVPTVGATPAHMRGAFCVPGGRNEVTGVNPPIYRATTADAGALYCVDAT